MFFGKVFTSDSISADPEKVTTLKAVGHPQSVAEVRSFLFFAGANDDFMEGFMQVTAPMRSFLRKDVEFQWTPQCQAAFKKVKALLTREIVMAYFDPHRKTRLKMDTGP